jgi:hypothetical protein
MIRFDTAGTQRMIIADDGNVGIGVDAPPSTLSVYANSSNEYVALIDNDASSAGHGMKITSDGTGTGTYLLDIESVSTTLFRFRGDGRLGIGTTSPGQTLTVEGDIGVGTKIIHKGDSDTFIEFDTDLINIECGGRQMIKMEEGGTDKIILNNDQANVDLQVKSDNHANLFRTDAANDTIGVKTNTPKCSLSVSGSMAIEIRGLDNDYDPGTTYAVAATDYLIAVNTRPTEQGGINSAITITLPLAASYPGRMLIIKDAAGYADVNNIIVTRAGSDTIDGLDTSVTFSSPAQCKHYVSNGISVWMDITG